jgi:arginase family enzyme
VPLLIGCDCSIVVGTTQALRRAAGDDVHVLYVDGDFDDAAPDPARCQSAAAVAVWLMTRPSPFWAGPPLAPSQVTVIGWSNGPQSTDTAVRSVSLADVRRVGPAAAAGQALAHVPASAAVLLHLDIDVFGRHDVPAAYFPHAEGLSLPEGGDLLRGLLRDPRIRIIEVAEYASLRDVDRRSVGSLIDLLADSLKR